MNLGSAWNVVERALGESLVDRDGTPVRARLILPGTGPNDAHFQTNRPDPMDPDYAKLLEKCSGLQIGSTEILFTEYRFQGFDCLMPDWLEILADGSGNFWCLETKRPGVGGAWGPVWFVCHDPPVMVLVSQGLAGFLEMVVDSHRKPPRRETNAYLDSFDAAMAVWNSGMRGMDAAECRGSKDAMLAQFAGELPDDAVVMDFRAIEPGMGFAWDELDWTRQVKCATDPLLRAGFREAE